MVIIWWSSRGVIHNGFLVTNSTMIAGYFYEGVRMITAGLVNNRQLIFTATFARPIRFRTNTSTLQKLYIRHRQYSPDLALTDYHSFCVQFS